MEGLLATPVRNVLNRLLSQMMQFNTFFVQMMVITTKNGTLSASCGLPDMLKLRLFYLGHGEFLVDVMTKLLRHRDTLHFTILLSEWSGLG